MSSVRSNPPDISGLTFQRPVGGGGFADVFLYLQHSTNRDVAVKVLRAEHLGERSLQQFRNEADVMARVSTHPFIVTVLDAGVATDGRPHIVMEYYAGPHFGIRARRRELGVPEVLRVGIQVASAVETAHRAGILHRDIKPANILTSEYGNPGLTDFGVAGVQTEAGMAAADGVSPGFTAPEVLLDETATGSRASDVYALGATIYALLTGRSPLWVPGGTNDEGTLLHRAATGEVSPIGDESVPRSLELLLRQCLQPDPALRPEGAVGLARGLQDVEQSLSLSPTPLALVGATGAAPRSREGGEDATRRRPRLVDPDSAPHPPPRSGPAIVAPAPTSTGPGVVDEGVDRAHTVLRVPPATAVDPHSVEKTRTRPVWLLPVLGGAAAVVLLAVIAVVTGTGTGSDPVATTTTILSRSADETPFVAATVGSPTEFTAARQGDGSVHLRWQPPTDPANVAPDAFVYDLFVDGDDEVGSEISATEFEISADESGDGPRCFDLYAVLDDASSVRASRACTGEPGEGG